MSQKHALLIANSTYNDTIFKPLAAPNVDIEALAKVLRDPNIGGFSSVDLLIDQPLSVTTKAIENLFQKKSEDLLLLYFSGHGLTNDWGNFYVVVRDTEKRFLASTAISDEFITRLMNNNFSPQVLILDCCYSGAFGQGAKGDIQSGQQVAKRLSEKVKVKGRVILTATGAEQEAWEEIQEDGRPSMSYFTRYLVEGVETGEADSNNDGAIGIDELYMYVQKRIFEVKPSQTPGRSYDKLQGEIVIARNHYWTPSSSDKANAARAASASANIGTSSVAENLPQSIIHGQPSQERSDLPSMPVSVPGLTRREVVVGLAGLAVVGVAGGLLWLARSQQPPTPPPSVSTPTPASLSVGTPLYTYRGHSDHVNAAVWSRDGKRIASGSDDMTVQVWNAADGSSVYMYHGHSNGVNAVAWSPDGKRIASASDDKTAQVWDATTGKTPFIYRHHSKEVRDIAWWSPDGRRIASASYDGTVQIWDAVTGQLFLTYKGHTDWVFGVAWSPDGKLIASSSKDKTARVWDASTGNVRFTYTRHTDTVKHVAWSPNGRRIASASYDGTVRVWDATTGGNEIPYTSHTDAVLNVAWSPNGQYIASASADKTARVWNVVTGDTLRIYTGHNYQVNEASWSLDGKFLVTASDDTRVRIWPTP